MEMPGPTVAIATLGCKVNQAESEAIMREFADRGYRLAGFDAPADVYVLNSCTVTHIADRKSRQLVRQARRHNHDAVIVVTGCYAEIDGEEMAIAIGADLVVGNARKSEVVALVGAKLQERQPLSDEPIRSRGQMGLIEKKPGYGVNGYATDKQIGSSSPSAYPLAHPLTPYPPSPLPDLQVDYSKSLATLSRTRAMVKVQDGCDNFCSYCIVPHARGRERSIPFDDVLAEVRSRVASGFKEIVLTGVHAGAYGKGQAGRPTLARLVERILAETGVQRLRLSSIEPWDLEPDLLRFLGPAGEGRFCRHLHLPLQSGSDGVLRRMRRRYTAAGFASLVNQARSIEPDAALTTDVIVGFPGETAGEFAESIRVCREMGFARTHVFRYSPRKGTGAATLPEQVDEHEKRDRSEEMAALASESARLFRRRFLGRRLAVLWEHPRQVEGPVGQVWTGLTDNYVRVETACHEDIGNRLLPSHIVAEHGDCLWAETEEAAAATGRR